MNSRKYNLNVSNVISCGVGTHYSNIVQCSILNTFTVSYNTIPITTCTYPQININDLKSISQLEYDKRIIDYLDTLKIDNEITKNRLFNESTFIEPDCSICNLNSDFLVYKFLSGIRIVNIGTTYGVAQYKVYPTTKNANNYSWKTNATFLDLDQNEIYVVEVRDYFENVEICRVSKIVSVPLLIPSTTLAPQTKLIRLKETSFSNINNIAYRTGCIEIIPSLQPIELFRLDYIANLSIIGDGTSCIEFTCKPNGTATFVNYSCLTNQNGGSPRNGSISIRYGDTICYNVVSIANTIGTISNANYCISAIDGLGTINPTIDNSSCSVNVTKEIQPIATYVSFTGETETITLNRNTINGYVNLSSPIPDGQSVYIQISGTNNTINGTSTTSFSCKPDGALSYISSCIINSDDVQPTLPEFNLYCGDQLCYDITLDTPNAGSSASASMCFNILTGSLGVLPLKYPSTGGNLLSVSKSIPQIPTALSVCRNRDESLNSDGYINLSPTLSTSNQYVIATFETSQLIQGLISGSGNNNIKIFCKSNNSASFNEIFDFTTLYVDQTYCEQGSITFRCGDTICYSNSISDNYTFSESSFCFTNIVSSQDISSSINSLKDRDVLQK